jgi:DNA repair exonuclease SbcCD nuclease subunit
MKFLYFTDSHLRDDCPKNRIDDFYKTQFKKLYEIGEIASKENCNFLLSGGDTFDIYHVSDKLKYDFISWQKNIKLPIVTIIGSHDMLAKNDKAIGYTSIGVLINAGIIQELSNSEYSQYITGYNYSDDLPIELICNTEKDYKIVVCHNMITPNMTFPFKTISIDQVKTNADLVLLGHWHPPFTGNVGNTMFVNPGSMTRLTSSISDMERNIQVVIVDIDKKSYKMVTLGSAKSFSEVFDLKSIEEEKEIIQNTKKYKEFFSSIKTLNLEQADDFQTIMSSYGKQLNISSDIVEKSIEELTNAKLEGKHI